MTEAGASGWENENLTDKSWETAWSSAREIFIYSKVLDSQRRRGAGYSTEAQDGFQAHHDEGNGREFSAWVQLTSGQPPGGVPNNLDIVRLRQSQQRSTTRLAVESRCPRSAPSGRRRSQALRMPQASVPSSPRSLTYPLWLRLLSHPPLGSGQPELARVTSGPYPPAGDRLQKKNVPLSFGPPPRVVAGFQFGSGLGTCGRGQRKNDCSRRRSWSGTCCRDTPEAVTRVRAACSVPRTGEREGASEAEESCAR